MPPPLVDIVDKSLPLPDSVERGLSGFHRTMRSHYIGIILLLSILLATCFQPLIAVGPILLFIARIGAVDVRNMQRFFDCASGWYMGIAMLGLGKSHHTRNELIFGIRIRTFGHRERFKRRSVFLMNHVCHFDWLYFWGVVERLGDLTTWKAITKDGIKKIPFLGMLTQYVCLIFIARRWEDDEKEFKKKLFYYNAIDLPLQLLLFPEGGDLTPRSKAKSDIYADANGLQHYEYCLHPRVRGFLYVMEALRSGRLDAVYDITVAYPDALAKTEAQFAEGKCIPREIHYKIQCYRAEDLPTDDKGLTQWLSDRWKEKEKTLELFYTHKQFMEPVPETVGVNHNGHSQYRPVYEVVRPRSYFFSVCAFAFYGGLMVILTYFFLTSWVWRWSVCVMAAYITNKGLTSGIDNMLADTIPDRIEAAYKRCHRREEKAI